MWTKHCIIIQWWVYMRSEMDNVSLWRLHPQREMTSILNKDISFNYILTLEQ